VTDFENFSRNKPILPGRVYNFDDLINTDHDLTRFTKAFYFNVVISSEKNYIISELKGKKIKVTEQLLGDLLNLPLTGHKLYGTSWFKMAGLNKKELMAEMYEPGTTFSKFPPSSQLKHEFKMLHNMCLHSIFPRKGSKDKVTENDMMMMYHMFNKVKMNLPYVLIQHMIYTIENGTKKITLPYGMFLTRVFRHFDVSLRGEEGKNSSTTFSLTNIGRMKQICDIEDHTVSDQGLKRKKRNL
jgi:hypothetical protein